MSFSSSSAWCSTSSLSTFAFAAKCKVLKELVEHHADEEEKEMFPEARKVLSRPELQELGDRMAMRKKELGA